MKVSQNDLLDALRDALVKPTGGEGGVTVHELVRATGRGHRTVRAALSDLAADGRLEVVSLRRTRLDGLVTSVPGYRLKPAPKPKR